MDTARIAAIPLFAGLSEAELNTLAEAVSELELVEGSTLTAEGEFGHALFAVEAGTADVFTDGQPVGTVGPGDVVGEIAVVASGRRTATVVATSPMRLIAFFKRDVWAIERSSPEVAERLRGLMTFHRDGS
jgi:CRP/FNR family transcriptional regulator, cyclic AMP receptor protein